jgi:hypothetical protein
VNAGKIYTLIPKIMKDLGPIGKDGVNSVQKYKFRGIDQMYNAIQPELVKHGVFCVPQVLDSKSDILSGKNARGEDKVSFRVTLRVAHKFYADDGSHVEVITQGEGLDTSDKASNKALSAAMKYAFIELFSIPTDDVADSDRESPTAEFKLNNVNVADDFLK